MKKKGKQQRRSKQEIAVPEEPPPKKVKPGEEESSVKYFAPEPVTEDDVDKNVTTFLLEETTGEGKKEKTPREEEGPSEEPTRDLTKWYIVGLVLIILVIWIIHYQNLQAKKDLQEDEKNQTIVPVADIIEQADSLLNQSSRIGTSSANATALQDFVLNTTGLRPIDDIEQLDDNLANLVNECNTSNRCKAVLRRYQKIGLLTESYQYTIAMDEDGRIVDLSRALEANPDFVVEASDEDLLALYNALAINDEETMLLKLQKILPSEVSLRVMQGMMAG